MGTKDQASGGRRGALEQAENPQSEGFLNQRATDLFRTLLGVGIDGVSKFDSAQTVASRALVRTNGDVEKAIGVVVNSHLRLAGGTGFVTSLGGFITMPVSLPINVAGFYVLATRMTAAIAALRGYDVTDPRVRTAILLSLVGSDADDVLTKAGVAVPGGRLASAAMDQLPGAVLMVVNKAVAFRLLATTGKKTLSKLGRGVPFAGGLIGGGLDTWLMTRIATSARQEFPPAARAIEPR